MLIIVVAHGDILRYMVDGDPALRVSLPLLEGTSLMLGMGQLRSQDFFVRVRR
jgi:hypothetical protein